MELNLFKLKYNMGTIINTLNIKQDQLNNGFFTTGSGSEVIFIMGSCRVLNFVNYLNEWNTVNGNRFTIYTLDPFNFCWDINEERVDYEKVIKRLETDERILSMLESVDIFLHEYYANFGMFNCDKNKEGSIYDFGIKPKIDICIPNWNDYFVLVSDIVSFDLGIRKRAIQDYNALNKLSTEIVNEIKNKSIQNLEKFYSVCQKSDIPEMEQCFKDDYKKRRMFWSYNHTSKEFTVTIFKMINDKYLHLDLSKGFNENHIDMFANNYTKLTDLDIELFGYEWNEEIVSLKDKLF